VSAAYLKIWAEQVERLTGSERTRESILLAWAYAQANEDVLALASLHAFFEDTKYAEYAFFVDIEYRADIRDAIAGLIDQFGIDLLSKVSVDGTTALD